MAVREAQAALLISFNYETTEIIFESLTDLFAEDSFLPSLFGSFDCNPLANDLAQPLVHLITKSSR